MHTIDKTTLPDPEKRARVARILAKREESVPRLVSQPELNIVSVETGRTLARGNKLTLKINGVLMSQGIDKQKGKAARSGTFAIQLHDGPPMKVQFKDIWLKKLTD